MEDYNYELKQPKDVGLPPGAPALCPVDPQIDRVGGGSEDPPITTYELAQFKS